VRDCASQMDVSDKLTIEQMACMMASPGSGFWVMLSSRTPAGVDAPCAFTYPNLTGGTRRQVQDGIEVGAQRLERIADGVTGLLRDALRRVGHRELANRE
jgi:hypothetical protein